MKTSQLEGFHFRLSCPIRHLQIIDSTSGSLARSGIYRLSILRRGAVESLALGHSLIFGYPEPSLQRASPIFICRSTPRWTPLRRWCSFSTVLIRQLNASQMQRPVQFGPSASALDRI